MPRSPLTSAQKQSRRNSDLDAIAQAAGWPTWTRYATAVKRGVVSIATNPNNQRSIMSGTVADFKPGDTVNVKYNGRWSREKFTISATRYSTKNGRTYNIVENSDTFNEKEIRSAK